MGPRAVSPPRATCAVLLALALGGAARAQGADLCSNAPDLGVGAVAVPFDTAQCSDTGAPATSQALAVQPCSAIGADVWFRWTATRTGDARFAVCNASYDTKLGLWRGVNCLGLVPLACDDDGCGLQSVIVRPVTLGVTYYVQVGFFTDSFPAGTNAWGSGTLTIDELAPVPNDTCATATAFPVGATAMPFDTLGATGSGFGGGGCGTPAPVGPDVFFQWAAPAAGHYEFRTCGSNGDTVLQVHRGARCNASCEGADDDACGLQSVVQLLDLDAGEQFLIQVAGYGAHDRPSGTLSVTPFTPPPCALADDAFEENDVCSQARPLADGTYPALVCREGDNDFYSVQVPPGRDLVVAALFDDSLADLDLYLWDVPVAGAPCGTVTNGPGPGNGALAGSFSATNNEVVTYRNTGATPRALLVEVDCFARGTQPCCTYELVVAGTGPTLLGRTFCAPTANTSGSPSTLWVTRPPVAGDAGLTLYVAPLPSQSLGFCLMSSSQVAPFPVSQGALCLDATALLRLQLAVASSGAAGQVVLPFPWATLPAPILSGQTWHFQYWHRDALPGGASFANFSRGLSLTFQ